MPKVIKSPVKKFKGSVTLSEPLSFPQVIAFQDAIEAASKLENITWQRLRFTLLPGILACVEKVEISGIDEAPTVDSFPATPLKECGELVDWLREEITSLLTDEEESPKE